MKDIFQTFRALHADAAKRGLYELACAYFQSGVRMGFEILAEHERRRNDVYSQMDRDLGDMIK